MISMDTRIEYGTKIILRVKDVECCGEGTCMEPVYDSYEPDCIPRAAGCPIKHQAILDFCKEHSINKWAMMEIEWDVRLEG